MVKASSYRQSTVKSGINVESEEKMKPITVPNIYSFYGMLRLTYRIIRSYLHTLAERRNRQEKKNRKQLTYSKNQTKSHYKNERINSQSDHDFIPFVFYHDSAFILAHKL